MTLSINVNKPSNVLLYRKFANDRTQGFVLNVAGTTVELTTEQAELIAEYISKQ